MLPSISIQELINRPLLKNIEQSEFLNKMTDDETEQYFKEVELLLEKENIPKSFPEWNSAFLTKIIDRNILYLILKNDQ